MEISDSRKLELDILFPDPLTTAAAALNTQKKPWGRGKGGCAWGVGTRGLSGKSLGVPSASEVPDLEKKRTQPRNATSADKEQAPRAACFPAKRPAKGQPSRTNSLQPVTAPPSQARQEKPMATLPSCPQRAPRPLPCAAVGEGQAAPAQGDEHQRGWKFPQTESSRKIQNLETEEPKESFS